MKIINKIDVLLPLPICLFLKISKVNNSCLLGFADWAIQYLIGLISIRLTFFEVINKFDVSLPLLTCLYSKKMSKISKVKIGEISKEITLLLSLCDKK